MAKISNTELPKRVPSVFAAAVVLSLGACSAAETTLTDLGLRDAPEAAGTAAFAPIASDSPAVLAAAGELITEVGRRTGSQAAVVEVRNASASSGVLTTYDLEVEATDFKVWGGRVVETDDGRYDVLSVEIMDVGAPSNRLPQSPRLSNTQ
ncbi:MAG: hypothetical protein AAFV62_02440 [Pseudomonadota bacterium]